MDHEDWVPQGGKGTVNCSGFPCPRQNISVSLPFLHTGCQRLFVACMNCRTRWKVEYQIECVTGCITVMVMYYTWTRITTLLSSFVWRCLVILPWWVTWMTDTRHLLGLLTPSHKSEWSLRTWSNASLTIERELIHLYIHSALSPRVDAQPLALDDDIASITLCTCFITCSLILLFIPIFYTVTSKLVLRHGGRSKRAA